MKVSDKIQIVEKPNWVSWDDIKQCLVEAHASNRAKGINMTHYQWSSEKIKESIGVNGIVLVALDREKVVGTASIAEKFAKTWYAKEKYAYLCYAGVLPAYGGLGLYRRLTEKREDMAKLLGYRMLVFDTHYNNKIIQSIAKKNGYRLVRFFQAASKDHYSVVMAKWVNGCPYSKILCRWKYWGSKVKTIISARLLHR